VEKEIAKQKSKKTAMFQDPKEYEKLPMEERRKLTDQMIGKHKRDLKMG